MITKLIDSIFVSSKIMETVGYDSKTSCCKEDMRRKHLYQKMKTNPEIFITK